MKTCNLLLLVLAFAKLAAQGEKFTKEMHFRDKLYVEEIAGHKRAVHHDHLRQASVSWEKRVWRNLDLREKMNQHLMFPVYETQNRISMLDLIKKGIASGQLTVFQDDGFTEPLSKEQAMAKFQREVVITITDSAGNPLYDSVVKEELTPDKITRFKVKEDWYFDNQRSVQEVRILGICPVYYDENKDLYIDKGWIYFPQARDLFVQHKTYNPKNDAAAISFDELFQKRFFSSFIEKESNVFDRYISEYTAGIESMLESERIKNDMYRFEHDLFHF